MAQTTEWLPTIWNYVYEEGKVEHIKGVWPVLSDKQLFTARKVTLLKGKTKPTIKAKTFCLFTASILTWVHYQL